MSKEIATREREREIEYLQKLQTLEEREEMFLRQQRDHERQRKLDVIETNKKIKTMHELIKTVMNLHREDIISFEQNSNNKVAEYRAFSFDLSKVVNEPEIEDNSMHDSSSDEKDKIIIKEPLEVFELENEQKHHTSEYSRNE